MLTLYLEKQKINKNGVVLESKVDISHSFIKNFLVCLYRQMSGTSFSLLDMNGDARDHGYSMNMMPAPQAGGGQGVYVRSDAITKYGDESGIIIGTGTGAVTAQDYYLAARIDHGTGAGEMEYFGGIVNNVVIDGNDSYFDIERLFRNNSGGSIIIKEYGFSVLAYTYPTLIIRDAYLEAGDWVTVADGEYLKVTYRIKVTV